MTSFLLNVVNKTIYIKIKNIMKKIINFLTITLIAFIIVSCCSQKKVTNTAGVYGLSLKYDLVIANAKQYQVDSLIKADTLPALGRWFTNSFRDYFTNICLKLARETEVDGFFWDEPHWAMPSTPNSFQNFGCDDWTCRCPNCMKKFEAEYGYEMPKRLNDDVRSFRRKAALSILSDTSKKLKEINPKLEITCCVEATLEKYYIKEDKGYEDWDMVASCPYFDVFATTIIDWESSNDFVRHITERTVKHAKKYGKDSERWLMGYYTDCEDYARIDEVVSMYENMGVDRLSTWTYRGGYGTRLAARDPLGLWDAIGKNYKRVMNKK